MLRTQIGVLWKIAGGIVTVLISAPELLRKFISRFCEKYFRWKSRVILKFLLYSLMDFQDRTESQETWQDCTRGINAIFDTAKGNTERFLKWAAVTSQIATDNSGW